MWYFIFVIFITCTLTSLHATKNRDIFENNDISKMDFHFNGKFKRHVDLAVFDNINTAKQTDINDPDAPVSVCGDEDSDHGIECYCEEKEITCWNGLKDANIKPAQENSIIEDVFFMESNITILKKDKIIPGRENLIKELSFYDTKIIQIEIQAFDKFVSLKSLSISTNLLKHIDENVLTQQLGTTLLTLSLSFNNLTFHDLSMFKYLINLQVLNLHGNIQRNGKIESKFPESLANLKTLKLGACGLIDLSEDVFENLRHLETLRLHFNNFTSIPSAINVLQNLKLLGFDENEIETLNKDNFALNTNLEQISLTDNFKLKYVGDCTFCSLPSLKFVDFWHCNNLSYIHENAFGSISNGYAPILDEFDIEECNISVLPEKLVNWKEIPKLSLNRNPFACNCSMAWLFNDLLSNDSLYSEKLFSLHDTYHHHKYSLGCLGPPPTTENHTHPYTVVEIFASCKKSTTVNVLWHFLTFFIFTGLFAALFIYVRRYKIAANWYTRMT